MKKAYLFNNRKISKKESFSLWEDSVLVDVLANIKVNKRAIDNLLIIKLRYKDMEKVVDSLEGIIKQNTYNNISNDLKQAKGNEYIYYFLKERL